jgi:Uma2 family endonuclease
MSVEQTDFISPEQYLAGETDADRKHEYCDGMIAALPGASAEHKAITSTVAGDLRLQLLGRPYRVFANHLRIKVEATRFYTYPDIVVICSDPIIALEGERPNTVVNPILILEVTSDATEAADETDKLRHYQTIPTLREYIVIRHRAPGIVSHLRTERGEWIRTEVSQPESFLYIASIDCTLTVQEVYSGAAVARRQDIKAARHALHQVRR